MKNAILVIVLGMIASDLCWMNMMKVQGAWPNAPFVDQCNGVGQTNCKTRKECEWITSSVPWCYDKEYRKQTPPKNIHKQTDYVKRFFSFSFGVHLSEGTDQQVYYNMNTTECAILCMRSSNAPKNIRCLSFDFYPFEQPRTEPPFRESLEQGICVLNSGNKDTGRLRNEDLGFSDAELYYKSFYGFRPFSNLDGYYEVRDPRGGEIADMLDYSGGALDFAPINVWGGSRWGITHAQVPNPIDTAYECVNGEVVSSEDPSEVPLFKGGYTPVDSMQHCPGIMSKAEAIQLCESTGGYLCPSPAEVALFTGQKIGCSYDGYPLWDATSDPNSGPRFVRCCAKYGIVDNCEKYFLETITRCGKFNSGGCVSNGSGTAMQKNLGFGHRLVEFRNKCAKGEIPNCKGLVADWTPRDDCIWCLDPNGSGSCRPGTDFGICPNAPAKAKALFSLKMKATCGPEAICRLTYKYPDLGPVLSVPTKAPTLKPTLSPTPLTPPPIAGAVDCKTFNNQKVKIAVRRKKCNNNKDFCKWVNKKCMARV